MKRFLAPLKTFILLGIIATACEGKPEVPRLINFLGPADTIEFPKDVLFGIFATPGTTIYAPFDGKLVVRPYRGETAVLPYPKENYVTLILEERGGDRELFLTPGAIGLDTLIHLDKYPQTQTYFGGSFYEVAKGDPLLTVIGTGSSLEVFRLKQHEDFAINPYQVVGVLWGGPCEGQIEANKKMSERLFLGPHELVSLPPEKVRPQTAWEQKPKGGRVLVPDPKVAVFPNPADGIPYFGLSEIAKGTTFYNLFSCSTVFIGIFAGNNDRNFPQDKTYLEISIFPYDAGGKITLYTGALGEDVILSERFQHAVETHGSVNIDRVREGEPIFTVVGNGPSQLFYWKWKDWGRDISPYQIVGIWYASGESITPDTKTIRLLYQGRSP